ncbi:MAG: hypothetical protein NTW86_13525 [Candidatus Sumerlaeota bacterium]|nr:hypothetical protein [Candidatus Sumerlaeota bacterium]
MKPIIVTETLPLADGLLKNWVAFRKFLRLAMSEQPITREQDQAFLQIKSAISKTYSQVRSRLPRQLAGSPDQLQDLMKQSLSVTHVRNMPAPDRRNLYRLWHAFYIDLCRTAGALKYMSDERYYPKIEEKAVKISANIKEQIAGGSGADVKKKKR